MTLRIMLVGLVASLGFEPPGSPDVEGWLQAGRTWFQERMLDRSEPEVERPLELAMQSDCQQAQVRLDAPAPVREKEIASDAAFEAVSEGIVAELSSDLLAIHRDEALNDQLGANFTVEDPVSVGLPEGEEVGCLILTSAAEAESAIVDRTSDSVEPIIGSAEPLDRVSSAVKLTREAIQAWADLMQQPVEECQPTW